TVVRNSRRPGGAVHVRTRDRTPDLARPESQRHLASNPYCRPDSYKENCLARAAGMDGCVVVSMLGATYVLALHGIRYPLQIMPVTPGTACQGRSNQV